MEKAELRSILKKQLASYAVDIKAEDAVRAGVLALLATHPTLPVLGYLPHFPAETGLEQLFVAECERGRQVFLPTVIEGELIFRMLSAETIFRNGFRGLREPENGKVFLPDSRSPIVVLPGLAFDRNGHRLGRGTGHYDRFLAQLQNPIAVGVCWGFQLLNAVPVEPHDRPVNYIVTENETVQVRPIK